MNDPERSRLTHEEIIERLPAFVVGALDPDEMLAVEAYIQIHPTLMERVHELEAAAARLAYAAPAQPLPDELQAKVIGRARASLQPRRQSRLQPASAANPQRPLQPATQPARRRVLLGGLADWWRRRGLSDLSLAGAVAVALILGIVLVQTLNEVGGLRRQVQELGQQITAVQTENSAIRARNVELQIQLQNRLNQLASLAGATQMVALGGTEAAPQASGTLYVRDGQGTLILSNLEPLSSDQTYQLWLIPSDGAPIPAGLLGQAGGPVASITLALPATLDEIAAVGISVEPPGGSAAPSGPIVLLGEKA
ncbi:MAG: anti-sigma factor [Caldilineaceae bacterium]|nr:anti-sigma factor [Caldilineaceae bacterium]